MESIFPTSTGYNQSRRKRKKKQLSPPLSQSRSLHIINIRERKNRKTRSMSLLSGLSYLSPQTWSTVIRKHKFKLTYIN
ncbi:hypothetical protein YC2023_030903 [Brassica napus]